MASEARPVQDAEKRRRLSGAGGGKEPSQPFSCSVFGSKGGQPTYLGAHVSPRSCRPFERAARIRSVPATCSLGSAWPFQGAPACPHKARWPSVRAAPSTGADGVLCPACPGQFSSCHPTSPLVAGPGGALITRALGRKEERGVSTELAHSLCKQRLIFSGTRTVKTGLKTPADGRRIGLSGQQARIL